MAGEGGREMLRELKQDRQCAKLQLFSLSTIARVAFTNLNVILYKCSNEDSRLGFE